MIDYTAIAASAVEFGFSQSSAIEANALEFRKEVRDMCTANKCHSFEKNWMCPPACGDIEHFAQVIKNYSTGIVVQVTALLEDSFDYESMEEGSKVFKKLFSSFYAELTCKYKDVFPMGAGTCQVCPKCAYPDEPCRNPDKAYPSLEACGLVVTDVCKSANLKYHYGANTITYSGAFFINE